MKTKKLREYEILIILRPDVSDDLLHQAIERVKGVMTSSGTTILLEQNWGKRKLAYEVKKHLKGIYYYIQFAGFPGIVEEVERTIKMLETIIRFQTVKLSDFIDLEKRLEVIREEKEKELKKREETVESETNKADFDITVEKSSEEVESSEESIETVESPQAEHDIPISEAEEETSTEED